MFTRRSTHRRTAATAAGLATIAVLVSAGPAAADPWWLDVGPCAQQLAKAAVWPGGDSHGHRFFSDAYDSYLSRQSACTTGT